MEDYIFVNYKASVSHWILSGYLIAGIGFLLLLAVLAHFIPLYDRFASGPHGRYLVPASILMICMGGYLRHRARIKRL